MATRAKGQIGMAGDTHGGRTLRNVAILAVVGVFVALIGGGYAVYQVAQRPGSAAHCQIFIAPDCSAAQSVHLVGHTLGFLAYILLWFTVLWGMMLGRGWAMTRFKHSNLYAAHMTLALIGMTLAWSHAFGQLFTPGGPTYLIDEFIPFTNMRDPIGVGIGTIGIEIMTVLLISMPLQRKLGYSKWRALHSLAYASFTLVAGHILVSGRHVGPLYVKIPVLALWLSTIVLWLGVSGWARKGKRAMTDAVSTRMRGQMSEVTVDAARCTRFGFCEQEAPEIFELRSDGRLGYKSTVPPEDIEAVARAVQMCPARAIQLNRAGSRVYVPQPRDGDEDAGSDVTPMRGRRQRGG
jgi:sulfoxide reductase heme-binding subunit YedZ